MTHLLTRLNIVTRVLVIIGLARGAVVAAQDPPAGAPVVPVEQGAGASLPETERPGLGQLHRDFGFPGAIRAWERRMYLNPRHSSRGYGYSYPSVYGSYYDAYFSPYGYHHPHNRRGDNRVYRESYDPHYEAYSLRLDHAYDLGVAPPEIQNPIAAQAERALTDYQEAMRGGYDAFHRGEYSQAARYFLLASQFNHGDPSSRLCAAHAQVALGQYGSAASMLHRAFDLQPKLAYLPLDIRDSYGRAGDFADHLASLREAASQSHDSDVWFLLGYYYYNSGKADLAGPALARACRLSPDDRVLAQFAAAAAGTPPK
jgi:tetratricopeptide (TPR) repeat protein